MGHRILIVDDEQDMLSLLEARLTNAGYLVETANNGETALRLVKSMKPDLILLDIMLPGIDGGEVHRILKSNPETKDIAVIFLSGLYTKNDEAKAGQSVGYDSIAKPYESAELLEKIKKIISAKTKS